MPAEPELDRPLPRARFDLEQRLGKLAHEHVCHLFLRAIPVAVLEHEGIGQVSYLLRIRRLARQPFQAAPGSCVSLLTPFVRREVQVAERHPARQSEARGVLLSPSFELLDCGISKRSYILGEKLHCLC